MIPPVNAGIGLGPVGSPAKIGGVNVRRQALLKAVKLIRPDKVHLAGQAGAIAFQAQIMREGGDGGGKFCRIVINAGA